jgi:uncharacterized repeat protein (TIGR02543 family)
VGCSYGTLENCENRGTVRAEDKTVYAGGVAGYLLNNTARRCVNRGVVMAFAAADSGIFSSPTAYAGGVTGCGAGSTTLPERIEDCENAGVITAKSNGAYGAAYAGGIVGSSIQGVTERCVSGGDVSVTESRQGAAGGVAGQIEGSGTARNCLHIGAVRATAVTLSYVGGVAGRIESGGTAELCASTRSFPVAGNVESGGTVTNCINGDADINAFLSAADPLVWGETTGGNPVLLGTGEDAPRQPSAWSQLRDALALGGYIRLGSDVTHSDGDGDLTVPAGVTATLDLNGKTVDRADPTATVLSIGSGGALTLVGSGGVTGGNRGVEVNGSFAVSGAPVVTGSASNVYLPTGKVIAVSGALTNTTPIGVTMETPGAFTSGLAGIGATACFVSDDAAYAVVPTGAGEAALVPHPVVTFAANGGAGTTPAQTVAYGAATALTANAFTRTGYTFAGWNTAAVGTGAVYANGASVTLRENLTLHARWTWTNQSATVAVKRGNPGTADLSTQTADGGTWSISQPPDGSAVYNIAAGTTPKTLTFRVRNDAAPGDVTVTVPVTGAAGCEDYAITLPVTVTDKGAQTLSFTDAAVEKTYGDADFTLAASHPVGDGAVSYASGNESVAAVDASTGAVRIRSAGTAVVTATAPETLDFAAASASYTLTVSPAAATVTADDKTKTCGDADPAWTATVTGLVNGDAESVIAYTLSRAAGEDAGTYAITPSGAAAQGNYTVTFVPGTLTVTAKPTYAVTVVNGTGSGHYEAGATVTVTASVPEGKLFDRWTGDGVTFANASAATTTFPMPARAVTVTANCKDAPQPVYDYGGNDTPAFEQQLPAEVSAEGGSVSVSPAHAVEGERVALTARTEPGYRLADLTVTRADGTQITVFGSGSTRTFFMPSGRIEIKARFERVSALPVAPTPAYVVLSPQHIAVNGAEQSVEAYNVGGTNFFKLRDLAVLLRGTPAQFNVDYDAARNAVVVTRGQPYAGAAGAQFTDQSASAVVSPQTVEIDGQPVSLTAYNVGGANFFGLRELAAVFGYQVDYDPATNTAIVESR